MVLYSNKEENFWDYLDFNSNGTIDIACNGDGYTLTKEETKELYIAMKDYYEE